MGSSHLGFPFWPSQSAQLYTKRSSASAGCVRGPCFKLPTPCAGFTVHSAVELTGSGSGRVPGHFSDTSPCLCSFCVRPAPERPPSAYRHRQGPDPLQHRPEQAAGQVALGQQEPVVVRVLHQPPTRVDKALLEASPAGENPGCSNSESNEQG